jgi:hypothetical protein
MSWKWAHIDQSTNPPLNYLQTRWSPSPNSEWTAMAGEIERKIMDLPTNMHSGDDTLKKVQERDIANCRLA